MKASEAKRAEARDTIAKRGRPKGSRDKEPRAAGRARPAKLPPIAGGACAACGAPHVDGQRHCERCGRNLQGSVCPKCEAPMAPRALFCGACGKAREDDAEPDDLARDLAAFVGKEADLPISAAPGAAAVQAAQPSPGAPAAAPDAVVVGFPISSVEAIWNMVDVELSRSGASPMTSEEKRELAKAWAAMLNKRAQAQGPNADIWACVIVTMIALGPRGYVLYLQWQRGRSRQSVPAGGDRAAPAAG